MKSPWIYPLVILIGFYATCSLAAKSVKLHSCNECGDSGCKPWTHFREIDITNSEVYLFAVDSEGKDRIDRFPNSEEMRCVIVANRGFAFDCKKLTLTSELHLQTDILYDGKGKFVFQHFSSVKGGKQLKTNISCIAK